MEKPIIRGFDGVLSAILNSGKVETLGEAYAYAFGMTWAHLTAEQREAIAKSAKNL